MLKMLISSNVYMFYCWMSSFLPPRKKGAPRQRKKLDIFIKLSQKNQRLSYTSGAMPDLLISTLVPGKSSGNEWESKIPAGWKGWSVFIDSVPHILFRGATALPWCSLLMPHSCNQEQDSNTCCFHHAQLFGCRRMAPLALKPRWTR